MEKEKKKTMEGKKGEIEEGRKEGTYLTSLMEQGKEWDFQTSGLTTSKIILRNTAIPSSLPAIKEY